MALIPKFTPGENLTEALSAGRLNMIVEALGEGNLVPGNGTLGRRTQTGTAIDINPAFVRALVPDLRSYVASGDSPTDIEGGAVCTLETITYDIGTADTETDSKLVTLDGGVLTFVQQGIYLCTYHAALKVDIGGATDQTTQMNTAKLVMRVGGEELTATSGYFGAEQKPNFKGFLKKTDDDEPWEPTVDLTTLVCFTETITPIEVVDAETLPTVTSNPSDAISAVSVAYGQVLTETFGVGGSYPVIAGFVDIGITPGLDPNDEPSVTPTASNAVTNVVLNNISPIEVIPATALEEDMRLRSQADPTASADFAVTLDGAEALQEPSGGMQGAAYGGASGTALIKVVWDNDSNSIKIEKDGTKVAPTLDVYGERAGGGARSLICENITLSILKIQ